MANFTKAYNDQQFWISLGFTLKIHALHHADSHDDRGYLIALLVAKNTPLRQFTRAVVFVPVVIGLGVSSLLWYWLFSYNFGLINRLLVDLGIVAKPDHLVRRGRQSRALGGHRLDRVEGHRLRHAALRRGDPGDPRGDHRSRDGRRRRPIGSACGRITLPLTYKTILLVTLVSVIGSLLAFDQFFLMTAGQPFNRTASSMFWIYLNSFPYLKLGYGAALSLMLAAIVLAVHHRPDDPDATQPHVMRRMAKIGTFA